MIEVREERESDIAAVRDVSDRAFGQPLEGRIVDALRSNGAVTLSLVAVLNGRFGFVPASRHGISCEWEVPDEAFMIFVLDESKMAGVAGVARYRQEFSEL